MLKALYDYALRQALTLPDGYARKTITAYVCLDVHGEFVGLEKCEKGEQVVAPDMGSLAQGPATSNVLVEKRSVVIAEDSQNRSKKSQFFLDALKDGAKAEPMLAVCVQALETPETVTKICHALDRDKIGPTERISFKVDNRFILDSDQTTAWWQVYRKRLREDARGRKNKSRNTNNVSSDLCLITGEPVIPTDTTKQIRGLSEVDGRTMTSLICFDKPAYCSYGRKQAANAPVSEQAFAAVAAALEDLLQKAPVLNGMKFVHWFDRDVAVSDDLIITCGDFGDFADFGFGVERAQKSAEQLAAEKKIIEQQREQSALKWANAEIESVFSGQSNPALEDARYYILLLTGFEARIMVRRFERGNYRELHERLQTWHDDLQLVHPIKQGRVKPYKLAVRLLRLLHYQNTDDKASREATGNRTAANKAKKKDTADKTEQTNHLTDKRLRGMVATILSAILTGGPLPDAVAAKALAYLRSEMLSPSDEKMRAAVFVPDALACQWLKAWLIRKQGGKEKQLMEHEKLRPAYNMHHPNPAYHCGGQMAVYAAIQHAVMPDVNASIVQRYYASAIQTPALVMGQLSHRATHHLSKIENWKLAKYYQDKLAQLSVAVGDRVPAALSLEDQSYFALGYYQMGAELNRNREERIAQSKKVNTVDVQDREE